MAETDVVLIGGLEPWNLDSEKGMSSSQLTFTPSFFRGVGQPSISYIYI